MWARVFVRTGWAMLVVVAIVFSIIGALVMSVGLMLAWSLLGVTIGVTVGKGLLPNSIRSRPSIQRFIARAEPDIWRGMVFALVFFLTCLAISGLVTVTGVAATVELLGCCTAAAMFVALRSRHAPSPPPRAAIPDLPAPATRLVPVIPVDTLPIDELCLAWRRSYLQLQRAADEPTRQRLIHARQVYLDELERRDRPGFTRWLDSGARPGGDPGRYLSPG